MEYYELEWFYETRMNQGVKILTDIFSKNVDTEKEILFGILK